MLATIVLALAANTAAVAAQHATPWDGGQLQLTRLELTTLLDRFQVAETSVSFTTQFHNRARAEAELVRARLRDGDFQVGDQINLVIEGETLPPTLTVGPGRVLAIPTLGELELTSVLRSELADRVREFAARYIQEPKVEVRSLVRVAVMGHVGRPGFYVVPAESLVSDVLMTAGGPLPTGQIAVARIERGADVIWDGKPFQAAIAEGRTLDQMSLRSGDQITLPPEPVSRSATVMRVLTMVPAAILAIAGLLRVM